MKVLFVRKKIFLILIFNFSLYGENNFNLITFYNNLVPEKLFKCSLIKNLNNFLIEKIFLLVENKTQLPHLLVHPKLNIVELGGDQECSNTYFSFINNCKTLKNKLIIISKPDVFFDDSLSYLQNVDFKNKLFILNQDINRNNLFENLEVHDALLFKSKTQIPFIEDFNIWNSNLLLKKVESLDLEILNASLTIKCCRIKNKKKTITNSEQLNYIIPFSEIEKNQIQIPYNVLVTGGDGYIGSCTVSFLAQKGIKNIFVIDKKLENKFVLQHAKCFLGEFGDFQILDEIFSKNKIDCVIHLGALTLIDESNKKPLLYYENNIAQTLSLFKKMQEYKVKKLIFASSCSVYGDQGNKSISEQSNRMPLSPYAKSKLIIEEVLKDLHNQKEFNLSFIALRYFNVAGAISEDLRDYNNRNSRLIPILVNCALKNKKFFVNGVNFSTKDNTCIRDYVHVKDVALANFQSLIFLMNNKNCNEFINIGSGNGFSVKEIISNIEKITKRNILFEECCSRKGDAPILIANNLNALNILNWKCKNSSIDDIIFSELEVAGD